MTAEALPAQPDPGPQLPSPPSTSIRRDVLSSYVLTASRLIAWTGVSAIVFRRAGAEAFALLALLRGTITLVSYTSLGIGPAMVRLMAEAIASADRKKIEESIPIAEPWSNSPSPAPMVQTLEYARPTIVEVPPPEPPPDFDIVCSGYRLAWKLFLFGLLITLLYAKLSRWIHVIDYWNAENAIATIIFFGGGTCLRLLSEPHSAVIQTRGFVWLDNLLLASAEVAWLILCLAGGDDSAAASGWWCLTSLCLLGGRVVAAGWLAPVLRRLRRDTAKISMRPILAFGVVLMISQLADFLYAPTDYILINRLLSPEDVAVYAPLVQIDSALLLLVAGPATALFPHFARAHAGADHRRLRRLYLGATTLSAVALLAVGLSLLLLSPIVFRLWLGQDLPDSRALLPLVLIHTVVGGSSAIGRSILLGMGKVKALTTSALVAGGANVILSALLASTFGLGLKGIVLGTVVVVVARCAIWMPWYVWRETRRNA